jgi:hypothetical protein
MKTLIKKAALDLISKNKVTTTLEVKEELIDTEPRYFWKQNFVSSVLAELADEGELKFSDNGTFRIYELPATNFYANTCAPPMSSLSSLNTYKYKKVPLSQRSTVKANLTELAKLVEDNAGKFMTVVHTKKTTGTPNVMNCQVLKGLTPLGAIQVKEQGQLKTIYPTDLLEVRLKGTVYQLK